MLISSYNCFLKAIPYIQICLTNVGIQASVHWQLHAVNCASWTSILYIWCNPLQNNWQPMGHTLPYMYNHSLSKSPTHVLNHVKHPRIFVHIHATLLRAHTWSLEQPLSSCNYFLTRADGRWNNCFMPPPCDVWNLMFWAVSCCQADSWCVVSWSSRCVYLVRPDRPKFFTCRAY